MLAEATPIIRQLDLVIDNNQHNRYGMTCYRSTATSKLADVTLITNGVHPSLNVCNVGSEAAALSTHLALDFKPSIILTAGTCGGFQQEGAEIGKAYIGGDTRGFIDRSITIPGYDKAVEGPFDAADSRQIAMQTNIAQGCPVTSSSFNHSDKELHNSTILAAGLPRNFEMEDASVARVVNMMLGDKPSLYSLRVVANLLDADGQADQFLANLHKASRELAIETEKVCTVLQNTPGKHSSQD